MLTVVRDSQCYGGVDPVKHWGAGGRVVGWCGKGGMEMGLTMGVVEADESSSQFLDNVEPYDELRGSFTGDCFDHCSTALNASFTMFLTDVCK